MHIAIAHSHLDQLGGGQRCTLELLRYLSPRHEVMLWTDQRSLEHTFPDLSAYPRRTILPAQWLSARPDAEVVIAQSFGPYLLSLRHPNVVSYLHTFRSRYLTGGNWPDLIARRWLDRIAVRRAAQLLTNSEFSAERALRRYGRRPSVVPPGVDQALFEQPSSAGAYGLYVGRLAPEKGLERLLAWMDGVHFPVRLVGDGEPAYVRRLRSHGDSSVEFLGARVGAALAKEYVGSRFLALLASDEEFGMAALEAMASAKPVIALRSGGLVELVEDGVTGFLVSSASQFADAVRRLRDDHMLCMRMGQAGRVRAKSFTWERFGSLVEEVCVQSLARQ